MKNDAKQRGNEPKLALESKGNLNGGNGANGDLDGPGGLGSVILRFLPLIMVILIAGYLASKTIARPIPGAMNLTAAALIPVSYEGRIQPLDSLARNELLIMSKRTVFTSDWLRPAQVRDWTGLARKLVADGKASAPSPGRRLWSLLSPDERKTVENIAAIDESSPQQQVAMLRLLNAALDDEGRIRRQARDAARMRQLDPEAASQRINDADLRFHAPADFAAIKVGDELQDAIEKLQKWDARNVGDTTIKQPLTRPQVVDLNRKLLSKAFPDHLKADKAVMEPAMVWLMDVFADQERANTHRIFRIEHDRVLELLGLEHRPNSLRYAIDEFMPKMQDLDREANIARKVSSKERDAYQNGLVDLASNLMRFMALAQYDRPYWVPPPTLKDDWKNFEEIATASRETGQVNPDAQTVMRFLQAYNDGDVKKFNDEVATHYARISVGFGEDAARAKFETFFNRFDVFYHLTVLYVFVFLLIMASWLLFSFPEWALALRRSGFWILTMLVVVHGWGLISRMYLMDRPWVFVTNLYASAVFVGFTGIIVALLVERVQKLGLSTAVACVIGFITGIVALHLRSEGDTLEMQQAVLDTNFWLATHVTTITFGYAATYLAGTLAIAYIFAGLFTDVITGETRKNFGQIIYGIICFALFLSFVGTVLGGIWADQSWGRFWGWDPKENGAVMIVIWNALILHARWGGMVQVRGMALLAIVGNIITTWSWFGTNQLGAGLHSYGFMDKAVFWIVVFCASQMVIIGIGLLPTNIWRSYQDTGNKLDAPQLPPVTA